jgi:glycine C-acetyltransferase
MDGYIANLPAVVALAEKYGALTMVDDSHAVGFVGKGGRGTHEFHNVMGKIDVITGTLGKALGGASGGYTSGRKEIVEWLRQRSRPYLFSNSLAPVITAASITALDLIAKSDDLRRRLQDNTAYFRQAMTKAGFDILPGEHPIAPVMIGDASKAKAFADALLEEGIYVIGFSFPVVPQGKARIRTQMSAGHTRAQLEHAVAAFTKVGKKLGII